MRRLERATIGEIERILRTTALSDEAERPIPDNLVTRALTRAGQEQRKGIGRKMFALTIPSFAGLCGAAAGLVFLVLRPAQQTPAPFRAEVVRKMPGAQLRTALEASVSGATLARPKIPKLVTLASLLPEEDRHAYRRIHRRSHKRRGAIAVFVKPETKVSLVADIAPAHLPTQRFWQDEVVETDDSRMVVSDNRAEEDNAVVNSNAPANPNTVVAPVLIAQGIGADTTIQLALVRFDYQPLTNAGQ